LSVETEAMLVALRTFVNNYCDKSTFTTSAEVQKHHCQNVFGKIGDLCKSKKLKRNSFQSVVF